MSSTPSCVVVAAVLLAGGVIAANAQSQFEEDFDDKDKPWQEIAIQLPAPPKPENLVRFYVSPTATQSFAIDTGSITVGADGVIRYTLVATSDSGVKNVSYEGIRCAAYERKLYAFGQADGSWSRSRRDQWEKINTFANNRHHAALTKDYFCEEKAIAGSAEDMIKRIRENKPLMNHYN